MAGQVVSPQQIEALAEAINAALAAEREQACKNADARYFEAALAKVKEGK
jgi:hypothetical protein